MPTETPAASAEKPLRPKRSDARRNEEALLAAAATVFVRSGVNAPIREIAAEADVGLGTVYRHFPTRSDLVLAVYRHQVETCANAAPRLLDETASPFKALEGWVDLFVEFLVTKHGLASAMQTADDSFDALHAYFEERLVPAVTSLVTAATEVKQGIRSYELMRAIGNLCIDQNDPRYDPRRTVSYLLDGLRKHDD